MRGSSPKGRFDIDYESASMYEGMGEELGGTVGQEVHWWEWESQAVVDAHAGTIYDDLYDVSDDSAVGNGRKWLEPFRLPTISAIIARGGSLMNDRGFYVTDTLTITVNVGDIMRLIPTMVEDPQKHIKDRLVYHGEVYTPSAVLPHGSFGYRWSVVTITCTRVNPEEMVNDPQFLQYAEDTSIPARDALS
jgi:hypothetical protein